MEHCKNSNFISQKATAKPTDLAVNESKLRVTDSLAFANNPHISDPRGVLSIMVI